MPLRLKSCSLWFIYEYKCGFMERFCHSSRKISKFSVLDQNLIYSYTLLSCLRLYNTLRFCFSQNCSLMMLCGRFWFGCFRRLQMVSFWPERFCFLDSSWKKNWTYDLLVFQSFPFISRHLLFFLLIITCMSTGITHLNH